MNGVVRWAVVLVVLVVLVVVGAGAASAQPPTPAGPPPQRPPFSPYLNLLNPNNSATQNYYGFVRPEQQFRQSIGNLQGAVAANQQAINGLQTDPTGMSLTGHPVQFLNTGGYFLNTFGGASGSGGRGVTRPANSPTAGGVPTTRR